MSAHTPGPFTVSPKDPTQVLGADGFVIAETAGVHLHVDYDSDQSRADGHGGHWATTPNSHREMDEQEEIANAALFAAAPDLLKVAKGTAINFHVYRVRLGFGCVGAFESCQGKDCTFARETIAKAEGR